MQGWMKDIPGYEDPLVEDAEAEQNLNAEDVADLVDFRYASEPEDYYPENVYLVMKYEEPDDELEADQ